MTDIQLIGANVYKWDEYSVYDKRLVSSVVDKYVKTNLLSKPYGCILNTGFRYHWGVGLGHC